MREKEPSIFQKFSEKFRKEETKKELEGKENETGIKVQVIKDYIERKYKKEPIFFESDTSEEKAKKVAEAKDSEEKVKKFFLKLSNSRLKKIFGKEFDILYGGIKKINSFEEKTKGKIPAKEEIEEFIKEKGIGMLPFQFDIRSNREFLLLDFPENLKNLNKIIEGKARIKPRIKREKKIEIPSIFWDSLQRKTLEYSEKELREKKEPIKIIGFEKLDFPKQGIEGKKFVELAAKILPSSENVDNIEYYDKTPRSKRYGGGIIREQYWALDKTIVIYRYEEMIGEPERKKALIRQLPYILAHAGGHSIDPRFIGQRDLFLKEQFEIIKNWEKVRSEEPIVLSLIIKIITDEDKLYENFLKSIEDWAESVKLLLTTPNQLKREAPKRYEFFVSQFKKRFPGFNPEENIKKMERYESLLREKKI